MYPSLCHLHCILDPLLNFRLLQRGHLRGIGRLVAMSVLQGGPGLPILLPAVYDYICQREWDVDAMFVPDTLVRNLVEKVTCICTKLATVCGNTLTQQQQQLARKLYCRPGLRVCQYTLVTGIAVVIMLRS